MPHDTPLISTIVGGLVLAFILGALANRLRMPPLVGYLVAGVLVGPHTPGYVADQSLAPELRRNRRHPSHVRRRAALLSERPPLRPRHRRSGRHCADCICDAARLGTGCAHGMADGRQPRLRTRSLRRFDSRPLEGTAGAAAGRDRSRQDRGRLADRRGPRHGSCARPHPGGCQHRRRGARDGRASFGRSGPALRPRPRHRRHHRHDPDQGRAVRRADAGFGRRIVPWTMHRIAHTGSRELFRLGVLAIALGVAFGASKMFGVSLALGAFFAGMVLAESELSHRAAQENPAASRCLRGSLLRLNRYAVRSEHPNREAAAAARHRFHYRYRQIDRRLPDRSAVPQASSARR